MIRFLAGAASALLLPMIASAQVGHAPQSSPYRDIEHRQELTWFAGEYLSAKEPAGVAPRNAPMVGMHYEFRMAGPAYLTARLAGIFSERRVIDPTKPIAERDQGLKYTPMIHGDVGFALNLTGAKSWRGLAPTLGGGLGIGAALDGGADIGNYKIGTPFLITLRPGIKFAASGRWQGRIDATNVFHRIKYPESYFLKTGADDAVFPPDGKRTIWRRDLGLTIGITRALGK
jgi:hypothetical protein